jgi:hypothetical protein
MEPIYQANIQLCDDLNKLEIRFARPVDPTLDRDFNTRYGCVSGMKIGHGTNLVGGGSDLSTRVLWAPETYDIWGVAADLLTFLAENHIVKLLWIRDIVGVRLKGECLDSIKDRRENARTLL